MKKNRAQKDIFYISLSSFILVVAWIGFNIYHRYTTSTVSEDVQVQLRPINPTFDTQVVQNLKARLKITPVYEVLNPASNTITPTPSSTQTASASATPAIEREITQPVPSRTPTP